MDASIYGKALLLFLFHVPLLGLYVHPTVNPCPAQDRNKNNLDTDAMNQVTQEKDKTAPFMR